MNGDTVSGAIDRIHCIFVLAFRQGGRVGELYRFRRSHVAQFGDDVKVPEDDDAVHCRQRIALVVDGRVGPRKRHAVMGFIFSNLQPADFAGA